VAERAAIAAWVARTLTYVSRLRYTRRAEANKNLNVSDQLQAFFTDLPRPEELAEVYLIGKATSHNNIWHLGAAGGSDEWEMLLSPRDLGMASKKNWQDSVDLSTRKTKLLGLNAVPTALDRHDVKTVFHVVWSTLGFMARKSYSDTPVHPHSTVRFRKQHRGFGDLLKELPASRPPAGSFAIQESEGG